MISSRWEKQNTAQVQIAYVIFLGTILFFMFPYLYFDLEGWFAFTISLIALTAGLSLAFFLLRHRANAMVRVIKFDYMEVERDFRILFKENNIQFNRKTKEDGFQYDFFGHKGLSMTLELYELLNLEGNGPQRVLQPATKITLAKLNDTNQTFVERLTNLIDEMMNQRSNAA